MFNHLTSTSLSVITRHSNYLKVVIVNIHDNTIHMRPNQCSIFRYLHRLPRRTIHVQHHLRVSLKYLIVLPLIHVRVRLVQRPILVNLMSRPGRVTQPDSFVRRLVPVQRPPQSASSKDLPQYRSNRLSGMCRNPTVENRLVSVPSTY